MLRRFLSGFICVLLICVISILIFDNGRVLNAFTISLNVSNAIVSNDKVILIDAGHGGLTNTID